MDSKKIIADSMEELLAHDSIDRLHVNDVVESSGMCRAIFYRHFYDKYEVPNWIYDNLLGKHFLLLRSSRMPYDEASRAFLVSIYEIGLRKYFTVLAVTASSGMLRHD